MTKANAKKILENLIAYKKTSVSYPLSDDYTQAVDIDAEAMVNGLPFWVHEATADEIISKKIFVNDDFILRKSFDEGHQLFYGYLFSLNLEIFAFCQDNTGIRPVLVKDYPELIRLLRNVIPMSRKKASKIINSNYKKMGVDEYEYIDYTRRKELFSTLYPIIPGSFIRAVTPISFSQYRQDTDKLSTIVNESNEEVLKNTLKTIVEYDENLSQYTRHLYQSATDLRIEHPMTSENLKKLLADVRRQAFYTLKSLKITTPIDQKIFMDEGILALPALESITIKNTNMRQILQVIKSLHERIHIGDRRLKYLDITGAQDESHLGITALKLPHLEHLDISCSDISFTLGIGFVLFQRFQSLKVLKADYLKLLHGAHGQFLLLSQLLNRFEPNYKLEELSLKETFLPEHILLQLLQRLPNIRRLALSDIPGHSEKYSVDFLEKLIPLVRQLECLHFKREIIGDVLDIASLLFRLPKLSKLHIMTGFLTYTRIPKVKNRLKKITLDGGFAQHALSNMLFDNEDSLKELKIISKTPFSETNFQNLNLRRLKKLSLKFNFENVDAQDVVSQLRFAGYLVSKCPNLEYLSIKLDHGNLFYFHSFFPTLSPYLKHLSVSCVNIDLATIFKQCQSLSSLSLDKVVATPCHPGQVIGSLMKLKLSRCDDNSIPQLLEHISVAHLIIQFSNSNLENILNAKLPYIEKLELDTSTKVINILKFCNNHPSLLSLHVRRYTSEADMITLQASFPHIELKKVKQKIKPPTLQERMNLATASSNEKYNNSVLFKDLTQSKLNTNTELPSTPLQGHQYFEDGNPANYQDIDKYRLICYREPVTYENGKAICQASALNVAQCIPVEQPVVSSDAVLKQQYESIKSNSQVKFGHINYTFEPGKWYKLPSYATREKLLGINQDLNLIYDPKEGLYYATLKPNVKERQNLNVSFLIQYSQNEFRSAPMSEHEFKPFEESIKSLRFDQNGKLIRNSALLYLQTLDKFELAKILYFFMHRKKAGKLEGDLKNDIDILNALIQQPYGSCKHRSDLFKALGEALGLGPIRKWVNDVHSFVEVGFQRGNGVEYCKFDLGGYPAQVQVAQNHLNLPSPPLPDIEFPEMNFANDHSVAQNSQMAPEEKPTFESYMDGLVEKILKSPPNERNILITLDSDQIVGFHAALLRYFKHKPNKLFCLKNLDEIREKSAIVSQTGELVSQESDLVKFVKHSRPNDAILLNWSDYNSTHLGHNSIMDDERFIADMAILPGVINVGVLVKGVTSVDKDITSRFALCDELPSKLIDNYSPADLCQKISEDKVSDEDVQVPFFTERWQSEILGQVEVSRGGYKYSAGGLLGALERNKKCIVMHNAPWHLESFQLFMNDLMINRCFTANGKIYDLPDDFTIKYFDSPFKLQLANVNVSYGSPNINNFVLNRQTLSSFMKGRSYLNKQVNIFEGILGLHANETISIYVTDNLTRANWAWFLAQAARHGCRLNIKVSTGVVLPEEIKQAIDANKHQNNAALDKRNPDSFTDDEWFLMETSQEGLRNNLEHSHSEVVITDDLEFAADCLKQRHSNARIISVNENTRFADLIGAYQIDQKNPLLGEFNYNLIFQLLAEGETVILKGNLPLSVRQQLETYFLPDSYFYLNGVKTYPAKKGKLILLSNNESGIPFVPAERVLKDEFEEWRLLHQYLRDEDLFQEFQMAVSQFEMLSGSKFSYVQLKTMLMKIAKGNFSNPFAAFFRLLPDSKIPLAKKIWSGRQGKPKPDNSADFFNRRKAKLFKQLDSSPYAFMVGPSGSGKSTFLLEAMKKEPDYKVYIGLENIVAWAESRGPKKQLLFLDEANIEQPGFWEHLSGIYDDPPGIFVKGKYYPLTDQHKIVMAGNYNTFENRFSHKLFNHYGNIISFKELPDFVLRDDIILPVLKLFNQTSQIEAITNVFIDIYKLINQTIATRQPLTPRNLKTMCMRYGNYSDQYQKYFTGDDRHLHMAIMAAYDEVATSITKEERKQLKEAIQNISINLNRRELKRAVKRDQILESEALTITKSRVNPLRLLKDALTMRDMKLHRPECQDVYLPGILFEGESGVGKSALIIAELKSAGYQLATAQNVNEEKRYYQLKPAKRSVMLQKLLTAFNEGAAIVIDEFNSLNLEREINTLLSGTDLTGEPAQKPGFFIIATQNPITMKRRPKLSEAILKRLQKIDLKDYTEAELIQITTQICKDPDYAEEAVEDYLAKRAKEDATDAFIKSTPRTLFRSAHAFRKSSKRGIEDDGHASAPASPKKPKTIHI